jgi:biopolymer transport protein ExbB
MLELMQRGGAVMYPILLCSILALAVVIERFYYLYNIRIDTKRFTDELFSLVKRSKIREAIQLCEATPSPIASIIKAGLLKYDESKEAMREAIEDEGRREVPRLEKNISILATIAHISPLLGLLGTVTGMVRCFRAIEVKAAAGIAVNPADLAGGIWEALLTTVFGLIVAIPVFVAYNYFVNRIHNFTIDMETVATDLLNIITARSSL